MIVITITVLCDYCIFVMIVHFRDNGVKELQIAADG